MPSDDSSGSRPLPADLSMLASMDQREYLTWQAETVSDKEQYWTRASRLVEWRQPFSRILPTHSEIPWDGWFAGGRLSAIDNCLVRWARGTHGQRIALRTFEQGHWTECSYAQLLSDVTKAASLLEGPVTPGDLVAIVMDGTRASVTLMLAAAWTGAVSVPLSSRLSATALAQRVTHSEAKLLYLGELPIPKSLPHHLADTTYPRILGADGRQQGSAVEFSDWIATAASRLSPPGREELKTKDTGSSENPVAHIFEARDPLLWVYANAASERPRVAKIRIGGFLVQAMDYHRILFPKIAADSEDESLILAMDSSAVAALAQGVWASLCLGWTVTLAPWRADQVSALSSCPADLSRAVLMTKPDTLDAIRTWAANQGAAVRFRQITCTGLTLRPKTVKTCSHLVSDGPHRITNLWYQTEAGSGLVATFPFEKLNRPGALGLPLPAVEAQVIDDLGNTCGPNEGGLLTFVPPWPALTYPVPGQRDRFYNLHFSLIEGQFSTRDGVRRDEEGFFWFMRRIGSEVTVDGISVSTLEVESVLTHQGQVKEAAVLPIQAADGTRLAAFVVPSGQVSNPETFKETLRNHVRETMGSSASPTLIVVTSALPRTRSGKVVRRLLRRLLIGDFSEGEDLDHLANPQVVSDLVRAMEKPQ